MLERMSDFLQKLSEMTSIERIAEIEKFDSVYPGLIEQIVKHTYYVKWDLDIDVSKINNINSGDDGLFYTEVNLFYILASPNMTVKRKSEIYYQIAESISVEDLPLLEGIRKGKLPYKNLTRAWFAKNFPHWETE